MEIKRAGRYEHPFSLAYFDLDNFKAVNDRRGHAEGDRLLRAAAQAIFGSVRTTDLMARMGGDEFAVLMPETGPEAAMSVQPENVAALQDKVGSSYPDVTISVGLVTWLSPPASTDEMVRKADELMYAAKEGGRNCFKQAVLTTMTEPAGADGGQGAPNPFPKDRPVRMRDLARTFFWIGLTSYGGPAIVAQIRKVTVRDKRWLTDDEFGESLAFCQTLPGPIAVQTGAHVAWRLRGALGALVATVAYVLPAFLLMLGLSALYFRTGQLPAVQTILQGLRAVVVAIVADSILSMAQPSLKDWRGVLLAGAAAAALLGGVSAFLVLLGAALLAVPLLWNVLPPLVPESQVGKPKGHRWRGPSRHRARGTPLCGGDLLIGRPGPGPSRSDPHPHESGHAGIRRWLHRRGPHARTSREDASLAQSPPSFSTASPSGRSPPAP